MKGYLSRGSLNWQVGHCDIQDRRLKLMGPLDPVIQRGDHGQDGYPIGFRSHISALTKKKIHGYFLEVKIFILFFANIINDRNKSNNTLLENG